MLYEIIVLLFTFSFLYFVKGGKQITNIKEYALGRSFTNTEIVAGWVAVLIDIRYMAQAVLDAFIFGISAFLMLIAACVRKMFFGVMALYFKIPFTIPTMGECYSFMYPNIPVRRLIGLGEAVSGFIMSLTSISVLYMVLSKVIVLQYTDFIVIAILIAIFIYSSQGGLQAVIKTDVIQVGIFCLLLPIMLVLVLNNSEHSLSSIDYFDMQDGALELLIPVTLISLLPTYTPVTYQRVMSCSSKKQAFQTSWLAGIVILIIGGGFLFIGMILKGFFASEASEPSENDVLASLFNASDNVYTGFATSLYEILFLLAMIALFMSTADTASNVFSSYIANDVFINSSEKTKLHASRIALFFLLGGAYSTFYICNLYLELKMLHIYNLLLIGRTIIPTTISLIFEAGCLGFVSRGYFQVGKIKIAFIYIGMFVSIFVAVYSWGLYFSGAERTAWVSFFVMTRSILPAICNISTVAMLSLLFDREFFTRKDPMGQKVAS